MFVKPAKPGLVIRDPRSHIALPDEGGRVPDTSYWHRRRLDGDVVDLDPPNPAAAPKKAAKLAPSKG